MAAEATAMERRRLKLGILYPGALAYSETFIRAHLERLPARVTAWSIIPRFSRLLLPGLLQRPRAGADLRRNLESALELLKRAALAAFFLTRRMDAVLAEYGPTGVAAMGHCARRRLPLIVHFHGFDAYSHETLAEHGEAYRRMFGEARAVVAVSRDMHQRLLELGAPAAKLVYIPYGVDGSVFQGADPATAPPLFLAVGRFVDKKAPHLTILAFQKVVEQVAQARLIMIGGGPLRDSCETMARALGIGRAVEFRGPRPHQEVAQAMRSARALVQHSVVAKNGDSEGTPVAVLEAGAAGLPVVSTRHGGIKDVVAQGETGFLVEEGDVEGMARAMLELARDPALAARLGQAARQRISADYSMEKSIARLWEVIEQAVAGRD